MAVEKMHWLVVLIGFGIIGSTFTDSVVHDGQYMQRIGLGLAVIIVARMMQSEFKKPK